MTTEILPVIFKILIDSRPSGPLMQIYQMEMGHTILILHYVSNNRMNLKLVHNFFMNDVMLI